MENAAPLLLLLFFWVFIGIPVSIAKKAADRKKAAQLTVQKARREDPAPAAPKPAVPEQPVFRPLTSTLYEPDHDDSVFTGSLGPVTAEGYDPCHEEQLSGMEPVCQPGKEPLSPAETSPGLPLGWTDNDIVRGIVMSEILNRKH